MQITIYINFYFQVTVLSNPLVHKFTKGTKVDRIIFSDLDTEHAFDIMSDELKERISDLTNPWNFQSYIRWVSPGVYRICDSMLENKELMQNLVDSKFDLMLFDIAQVCSTVIKDYLNVPAIIWSNYGPSFYRTAFYPEIPSFMCPPDGFSCTSDTMSFTERAHNLYHLIIRNYMVIPEFMDGYNILKRKHNLNVTYEVESVFSRSIIMAMIDFSIEFPRPLMPNVVPIPYLFRKKPNPLSSEIQDFISMPHRGVIYLSFGTLMDKFEMDKATIISEAFSLFPEYRFIWRNTGEIPSNLPNNTIMLDWAPQLDILASSNTKIFITHCGVSSTYETIIHGMPFIAAPLFWDQDRNAEKIISRGKSGIRLDFYTLTVESLSNSLTEILDNYEYYQSHAKQAADRANNHPVDPKQQFLWWANYTIRTNGAKHLINEHISDLNYFQYIMLDVICTIVAIFCLAIGLLHLCIKRCIL